MGDQMALQILDAVAGQGRDHEDPVEDTLGIERLGQSQQLVALQRVDLVQGEQRVAVLPLEFGDDRLTWSSKPSTASTSSTT